MCSVPLAPLACLQADRSDTRKYLVLGRQEARDRFGLFVSVDSVQVCNCGGGSHHPREVDLRFHGHGPREGIGLRRFSLVMGLQGFHPEPQAPTAPWGKRGKQSLFGGYTGLIPHFLDTI